MTGKTLFKTFLIFLCLNFVVNSTVTETPVPIDVNITQVYENLTESVNSSQSTQWTDNSNTDRLNTTDPDYSTDWVKGSSIGQYSGFCDSFNNCFGVNQVCVDNKCQCEPNSFWDNSSEFQSCQQFSCNNSSECQTYDSNRYCSYGFCSCNENTEEDISNGKKCMRKTCSVQNDCPDMNCVIGHCYCRENHRINGESGQCEPLNCTDSDQCQTTDWNAFCDQTDNMCKCKDTYSFHIHQQKCMPKQCYDDNVYCFGKNQSCFEQQCYCDQDFYLSDVTGECELNFCSNSSDCQLKDENSFCFEGLCKCNSNSRKTSIIDQLCIEKTCSNDISCPDPNALCVDGKCECGPNYRMNNRIGKCEPFICQDSEDCQSYDENRLCANGLCVCDNQMYFANRSNGFKCAVQSCQTQSDCKIDHTVCLDQSCRCADNYVYNTTSEKCQYFECQNSTQCQAFDEIKVCVSGQCLCPSRFQSNDTNGGKCVESSKTYHMFCFGDNACDNGLGRERCVDNECRCAPNYRYNSKLLICEPYQCVSSSECKQYDVLRICDSNNNWYNKCICDQDYVPNEKNGGLCILKSATHEKYCTKNIDCYESNQGCVDNVCQCQPNYKWDPNTQKCEYFRCSSASYACSQTYDMNRVCDIYGSGCVCSYHYKVDPNNGWKCTFTPITFNPIVVDASTYKYDYTWTYVSVPIIFILAVVIGLYRIHRAVNRGTRPTTTVRTNA